MTTVTQQVVTGWSGPLPSPATLRDFDAVVPNGAERIVAMAEREQIYRIEMNTSGQAASIVEAKRGQWLGAAISLAAIAGAVVVVWLGAPWPVPVALVSVPVGSVVLAIIKRTSRSPDQR